MLPLKAILTSPPHDDSNPRKRQRIEDSPTQPHQKPRAFQPPPIHQEHSRSLSGIDALQPSRSSNLIRQPTQQQPQPSQQQPSMAAPSGSAGNRPMSKPPSSMRKRSAPTTSPSSAGNAAKKRKNRPPYSAEQDDFIRFVRDDLCHSWEVSAKLYNQHWHADGVEKREIPGLQSRYYRLLDESVRDRKKDTVGRPELGVLAKTDRRYWWMEGMYTPEEREAMLRGEQAGKKTERQASSSPSTSSAATTEGPDIGGNEQDCGRDAADRSTERARTPTPGQDPLTQQQMGTDTSHGQTDSSSLPNDHSPKSSTGRTYNLQSALRDPVC